MRIIALALLLAGCAGSSGGIAGTPAPDAGIALLNQVVRLGDVTVRPIEVVEDSRCPRDVMCVWAGRLRLRAVVAGEEAVLTLNETHELPRGGSITLVSVSPDRWRSPPPDIDLTPRFGFRFAR